MFPSAMHVPPLIPSVPSVLPLFSTKMPVPNLSIPHPTPILLCAYEWTDHRAKVICKEAQITKREHQLDQVHGGKERATHEAGVAEKNWVDVEIQCNRKLKNGRKVMQMEVEAKELGKVMIKLRTKAEIKEGTTKG